QLRDAAGPAGSPARRAALCRGAGRRAAQVRVPPLPRARGRRPAGADRRQRGTRGAARAAARERGHGGGEVGSTGVSKVFIHESAYVDEPSEIGEGTTIWHFAHVLPNTRIGKNCVLGQNVMAGPDVTIGDNCKVQNNVALYKGVVLEDGVFCG